MRINENLYYQNPYNIAPNFKRQVGPIRDVQTKIQCLGNTLMFRDDIIWGKLPKFLAEKYKDVRKVTFIDHACSSGEEAFSIVMKLFADLGREADKFFPIIAKDLSPENIKKAKAGKVVEQRDEAIITCVMTKPYTQELVKISGYPINDYLLEPTGRVRSKIKFSEGNVLEDVDNMPTKNVVLFCRNCWQYLEPQHREVLMSKIASKFKDDSCILFVGQADYDNTNISYLLDKYGFVNAGISNAYVRTDKPAGLLQYLQAYNGIKGKE